MKDNVVLIDALLRSIEYFLTNVVVLARLTNQIFARGGLYLTLPYLSIYDPRLEAGLPGIPALAPTLKLPHC